MLETGVYKHFSSWSPSYCFLHYNCCQFFPKNAQSDRQPRKDSLIPWPTSWLDLVYLRGLIMSGTLVQTGRQTNNDQPQVDFEVVAETITERQH
jgi:hypothetical protein